MIRCESRPKQNQSANEYASTDYEERGAIFLGILNYLSKFPPAITEACEPLCKLTSVRKTGHGTECATICKQ